LHDVFPEHILKAKTPSEDEARRELVLRAAKSVGIGTLTDLADYHRQTPTRIRGIVKDLVEAGDLEQVRVEGWRDAAFMLPSAARPRSVDARALLSPFDSVVWCRPRIERLFNFHYRIEIYTPAPKRIYGYYVLPFLLGDSLVARVDVKADRKEGVLLVPGAYSEPDVDIAHVTSELMAELRLMATWLGLHSVRVGSNGDLSRPLAKLAKAK
jgi:uncharacterized protein YcaQ